MPLSKECRGIAYRILMLDATKNDILAGVMEQDSDYVFERISDAARLVKLDLDEDRITKDEALKLAKTMDRIATEVREGKWADASDTVIQLTDDILDVYGQILVECECKRRK